MSFVLALYAWTDRPIEVVYWGFFYTESLSTTPSPSFLLLSPLLPACIRPLPFRSRILLEMVRGSSRKQAEREKESEREPFGEPQERVQTFVEVFTGVVITVTSLATKWSSREASLHDFFIAIGQGRHFHGYRTLSPPPALSLRCTPANENRFKLGYDSQTRSARAPAVHDCGTKGGSRATRCAIWFPEEAR